jgi:tetratricopeptide (TPR) repeat protein
VAGALFSLPMMALLVLLWDNARGLRYLGIIYLHHPTYFQRSADYLSRAIAIRPEATLHALRGLAWSRLDDRGRADADWQRARELDSGDITPEVLRGDEQIRRGDIAAAIATLVAAARAEPGSGAAHASLGLALVRNDEPARALEHLSGSRRRLRDPRRRARPAGQVREGR